MVSRNKIALKLLARLLKAKLQTFTIMLHRIVERILFAQFIKFNSGIMIVKAIFYLFRKVIPGYCLNVNVGTAR